MIQTRSRYFRSIFISDLHIGAKTFNAASLLNFLKSTESQKLYLVGDIIDGWKLERRWYWTETVNQVFDELLRKAAEGTEIIYIPGNHDDAVRHVPMLRRLRFAQRIGIKITNAATHKTLNGRRFIVMHGDQFDTRILSEPVLKTHHKISNWLANITAPLHKARTTIENGEKLKNFSLAKYISRHGRTAIQTLNNFEGMVYSLVKEKNMDGIICGHTHIPVLKPIKDITYANTGSWLRTGNTALVEDESGTLSLLDWDDSAHDVLPSGDAAQTSFYGMETAVVLRPASFTYRPVTEWIVKHIRDLWNAGLPVRTAQDAAGIPAMMQSAALRMSTAITLPENGGITPLNDVPQDPVQI